MQIKVVSTKILKFFNVHPSKTLLLKISRLANLMPTEDELQQLNEELKAKEESIKIDVDVKSGSKKVFDELDGRVDDVLSDEPESRTHFRVVNTKRDYEAQLESRVADSVLKFRETMLFGAGSKNRREKSEDALRRKQKMKVIAKSGKSKLC